jgi:hypothetical protein
MGWDAARASKICADAEFRAIYQAAFTYFPLAPADALVQIEAVN